ncbi:MAG: transporter substrate-binding domain-containing protein [Pseudodesulfovibrio sp.]
MRSILFTLIVVLSLTLSASAESLRVVTEEWPPYNHTVHGIVGGLATEAVRAVLERAGLDYTIESLPWARAYSLAQHEPWVMVYSILRVQDREPLFQWVVLEGMDVGMHLFRPKSRREIRIKTLDDAKAYRVGVTRQSSPHHFLLSRGFVENANLFPVNNARLNLLKSKSHHKRIDLIASDPSSLELRSRQEGLPSDYWVRLIPLFHDDLCMAFSLKTPEALVERVRRAYAQVRAEGGLDAILARFRQLSR